MPQLPPRASTTSARSRGGGGDGEASTTFNRPFAKKPIERLSGDQKGKSAPSPPGTGYASGASSSRTHRRKEPSASRAPKARRRPSGDNAGGDTLAPKK
ncbi:MAG: hypothetical protein ACRD3M_10950 [Thermoanaerobaculia bacterium]